jgi:hypothetical protein
MASIRASVQPPSGPVLAAESVAGTPDRAALATSAAAETGMPLGRPVRVLYVMGYGRSGSTALSALLGGHPQALGAGELTNLVGSGWLADLYCACGERGSRCPFWSSVRRTWARLGGGDDLVGYQALQRRFEPLAHLPWTVAAARRGDAAFRDYGHRTALLFAAVLEVAAASVVVDTSKVPGRAYALARMPGVSLSLVHLVRDVRGVAWSLKKPLERDERQGVQRALPSRPPAATALRWLVTNLACVWIGTRLDQGRPLVLRYEDLARAPAAALAAVGGATGLDYTAVAAAVARGEAVEVGHCIAGNRLRMRGPLRLRLDEEWRRALSPSEQRRVWLFSGGLARRYGYTL